MEQLHAYAGLAAYNLSHTAKDAERDELLDAAIESLDQQLSQFPNGTLAGQAAYYRAESLYDRGRLDEAVASLQGSFGKVSRASATGRSDLCTWRRGTGARTIRRRGTHLRRVRQQSFPNIHWRPTPIGAAATCCLRLAEEQLAGAKPRDAQQTIERLLAEYPESALVPPALLDLAHVQLAESNSQTAEASLDQCLERCTERAVALEAHLLRAEFAAPVATSPADWPTRPRCWPTIRGDPLRCTCAASANWDCIARPKRPRP